MKFHYKKYSQSIFKPIIPIEIRYQGKAIIYEVLIDSGADLCIFDAEIGDILGIDVIKGRPEKVGGITGVMQTYYVHRVTIVVEHRTFQTEVGFLPNMPKFSYGIVGQMGFFDQFKVTFNYKNKTIFLK